MIEVLREPLKWLADLKVGDKAMAIGYRSRYIVYTVERLTKTRIVMGCGARFSRDSGKFQGSAGYHVNYLMKFDHDLIAAREPSPQPQPIQLDDTDYGRRE